MIVFCERERNASMQFEQVPMFFRLIELIIALYYGAVAEADAKNTALTKPPLESTVDRDVPCEYCFVMIGGSKRIWVEIFRTNRPHSPKLLVHTPISEILGLPQTIKQLFSVDCMEVLYKSNAPQDN